MTSNSANPQPTPPGPRVRRLLSGTWSLIQIVLSLAIAGGVLVYLWQSSRSASGPEEAEPTPKRAEYVKVVGSSLIQVESGSALEAKIESAVLQRSLVRAPGLKVTGTVAASLRPGKSRFNIASAMVGGAAAAWRIRRIRDAETGSIAHLVGGQAFAVRGLANNEGDDWQFNLPEVLTAFTDWQKSIADITFAESQLVSIRDLANDRVDAQQKLVEQMRKLVAGGTESQKNLNAEEANLRQYRIQGRKDVYEAESAVKIARRNEAALARQLQQAGLDPGMLNSITGDVDIVMAEVPEAKITRVRVGRSCEAVFFGIPGHTFTGRVKSLSPILTKDRRTLRALFTIDDLRDQLRPGMYAEIGLDTEPRETLLMPADGVLHVGRSDYALVADKPGMWRVVEVRVGEAYGSDIEILDGLQPDDRVMGKGAVLLKPLVVRALQFGNGERRAEGGPR
jgi:membrane fusion protein, heavy metal efflux system